MNSFLDKMRQTTGIGLNEVELYNRAYEWGVLLKDYIRAADIFHDAAKKYAEKGNQFIVAHATANSLLYRYLATGNSDILPQLLKVMRGFAQFSADLADRPLL